MNNNLFMYLWQPQTPETMSGCEFQDDQSYDRENRIQNLDKKHIYWKHIHTVNLTEFRSRFLKSHFQGSKNMTLTKIAAYRKLVLGLMLRGGLLQKFKMLKTDLCVVTMQ